MGEEFGDRSGDGTGVPVFMEPPEEGEGLRYITIPIFGGWR